MEERRPVVKRQLAVSGNKIAVVVDHVDDEEDGFEERGGATTNEYCFEPQPSSSCFASGSGGGSEKAIIKPAFHVESIDDEPSLPSLDNEPYEASSATYEASSSCCRQCRKYSTTGDTYDGADSSSSHCYDRPPTIPRNGFIRPSLSVEMAGTIPMRRGSATAAVQHHHFDAAKESAFGANPMRVSVSACNLLSLQNSFPGHPTGGRHHQPNDDHNDGGRYMLQRFGGGGGGLSEPESMGGSYESLPDVCLTTPSGAQRPLTAPYLSSIPSHLTTTVNNHNKLGARGRSSSSGWTGGFPNLMTSNNTSPTATIHSGGCATACVNGGPSLGSLFTNHNNTNGGGNNQNNTNNSSRRSSVRSSWAGEEFSLHNTTSLDFLSFRNNADHHLRHVKTEQLMSKHALKARLSKLQCLLDKAFALIGVDSERTVAEGLAIVLEVMTNCYHEPKIGLDLACGLCAYLRESGYLDTLLDLFIHAQGQIRLQTGKALERCMSGSNRDYVLNHGFLDRLIPVAVQLTDTDSVRVVVRLLETLFKHDPRTSFRLIELSALDYLLNACKSTSDMETFRHASIALANLAMYSDNELQQRMIAKNVPEWLFLLASSQDDVTRYYACLAICALVTNKEIEAAVIKSGTLTLVEPFLLSHKPSEFATGTYKHCGRPKEFLEKLVQMLNGKRREPRSLAAFHFAMDASIKEKQDRLDVLREIGAVQALKQVAALPEDVAPKFAIQALEIIGEEVPHKLSQQVPLWSVEDVQYWIVKIGFEEYASAFASQKVDGDLLLLLTQHELERDIGVASGLLRKRFMRELDSLKMAADYSCVDESRLDRFLISIDPHFSVYTYKLLDMGVDCASLPKLTDDMMRNEIENPVHRMKICQWMEECKQGEDMEVTLLSKQIDIFISYRRSTGNQLASLLKVLLQLRGYKIFIDVDRLYAGKFDSSLLKNIQAAKHFVLVLTPHALDRCMGDEDCSDWVHKEVLCAMEYNKNVIPVLDPQFAWPDDSKLPADMRALARFNGVHWVHEYQEACVDKLEKFIKGELNINRSLSQMTPRSKAAQLINYRKSGSNGFTGSNSNLFVNHPDCTELVLEALATTTSSRGSSNGGRGMSFECAPPIPPTPHPSSCSGCANLSKTDGICHHS